MTESWVAAVECPECGTLLVFDDIQPYYECSTCNTLLRAMPSADIPFGAMRAKIELLRSDQ